MNQQLDPVGGGRPSGSVSEGTIPAGLPAGEPSAARSREHSAQELLFDLPLVPPRARRRRAGVVEPAAAPATPNSAAASGDALPPSWPPNDERGSGGSQGLQGRDSSTSRQARQDRRPVAPADSEDALRAPVGAGGRGRSPARPEDRVAADFASPAPNTSAETAIPLLLPLSAPPSRPSPSLANAGAVWPRVPLAARLRGLAADGLVHAALLLVVWAGLDGLGIRMQGAFSVPIALFVLAFSLVYTVVPLALWGHSPGMAWAGLAVRGRDGAGLGFALAGRRWVGELLTLALLGLPEALMVPSLADRLSATRVHRQS